VQVKIQAGERQTKVFETQEAEARRSQVRGQSGLYREFKASLGYITRPYVNNSNNNNNEQSLGKNLG
jgi:hypothetical protein